MNVLVSGGVTYIGDLAVLSGSNGGNNNAEYGFVSQYKPVPSKSEWGMDVLTRGMRGIAPNLAAYLASLAQGQTFIENGQTFYLQTWEPDNNPVLPTVTLHYKGLIAGIPAPKADGQNIEASASIGANEVGVTNDDHGNPNGGYQSATSEIRYITRSTRTRYITDSRPTAATYGVDVSADPVVLSNVIRAVEYVDIYYPPGTTSYDNFPPATANRTYSNGMAPANLATALTPALIVQSFMECTPVVGSPYFECTDAASRIYAGS